MASVCKSGALLQLLHERINALFKDRFTAAQTVDLAQFNVGLRVMDTLYTPEVKEALEVIKKSKLAGCLKASNVIYVKFMDGKTREVRLPTQQYINPEWGSQWGTPLKFSDPEVDTYILAKKAEYDTVERQRDALLAEMGKAWNAVSSFNQLAKVWPPVLELVKGTDYLTRLYQKAPPREASKLKEKLEVDTSVLNAELLKAKIASQ